MIITNGEVDHTRRFCIAKSLQYNQHSQLELEQITVPTNNFDRIRQQLADRRWMDEKSVYRIVEIKTRTSYQLVDEQGNPSYT